jgi:hypothetical protein
MSRSRRFHTGFLAPHSMTGFSASAANLLKGILNPQGTSPRHLLMASVLAGRGLVQQVSASRFLRGLVSQGECKLKELLAGFG